MKNANGQRSLSKQQIDSVIALYLNGNFQEAIDNIKALNEKYPNVPLFFNILGACYKALGQLEESVRMFETAVTIKPDYAEAHKNLGISLKSLGQLVDAVKSFNQAIMIEPNYVDAHYNLAITLKELDQLNDAAKSYEKLLAINPNFAEAHNNLGNVLKDLKHLDDAVKSYQKAITINPNFAEAHNNLGNALKDLKHLDDAVISYQKAITINPNFTEAHNNLGNALKDLKHFDDAVKTYQRAITINPNFAEAHYNKGIVLKKLRKLDDAVKSFKNAITIKPGFTKAHNNLGSSFYGLGQFSKAIECFEKVFTINPNYAEAHNNRGSVLTDLGRTDEAIKCYGKAIEIKPDYAEAYANLGSIYRNRKIRDKALACFELASKMKPDMDGIFGDIVSTKMKLCIWDDLPHTLKKLKSEVNNNKKVISPFSLLGLIDDPKLQRKASELFANYYYPQNHVLSEIGLYPKHKKIRIGYFSADFRIHAVATLTAELFETHDRDQFEIHAFSFGPDTKDEMNRRIKAGVDHFHDVSLMSHKETVVLSRSLEIDIAVDLGGYTAKARTEIFAMAAAPIQASYIGYLGTMGANYYDYLVADQIMIPEKNQKYYSEKIVYLPNFQVNVSKESSPEVFFTRQDLGLPEKGFVFCCFNNTYKITPTTFDSWARILDNVKGSVLLIYADSKSAKENLTKEISLRGIDSKRLIFGERLARPEYLARYRVADLFLDTLPYNAGTTASDALRMGLPLLTLKGSSYQSRMAASIVNAVNLPELITTSQQEYESLAMELATEPEKLKVIKDKLIANLSTAPLYDTPLFTRNLESAYSMMYDRYQKGLEPDHIYVEH